MTNRSNKSADDYRREANRLLSLITSLTDECRQHELLQMARQYIKLAERGSYETIPCDNPSSTEAQKRLSSVRRSDFRSARPFRRFTRKVMRQAANWPLPIVELSKKTSVSQLLIPSARHAPWAT